MLLSRAEATSLLPSAASEVGLLPPRPEPSTLPSSETDVESYPSDVSNDLVPNDHSSGSHKLPQQHSISSNNLSCYADTKVTFASLASFYPNKSGCLDGKNNITFVPSLSLLPSSIRSSFNSEVSSTTPTPSIPSSFTNGETNSSTNMSAFMRLARKCNAFYFCGDLQSCRPFFVGDKQIGLVQQNVLEAIRRHPEAFWEDPLSGNVWLHPSLKTYDERSERIDSVLRRWKEESLFVTLKGWREECYQVRAGFAEPPLLKMERAATCLFGIRQYGVDINGYTRIPHLGICLWLQRRSRSKPTWPGMWDNMAAGGLSVGHSVLQTALKETMEEASIPPHLLVNLKAAGSVSFYFESERGLFPNTEFVFDLELPADFVPCNADGEVESFELVPVSQVMERILSSDFKTTSCPVTLDFLIRHGFLNSDNEPHLPELIELLHLPLHLMYNQQASITAPSSSNHSSTT